MKCKLLVVRVMTVESLDGNNDDSDEDDDR